MSHTDDSISPKYNFTYIEQCTDGEELETIYKTLINEPARSSSYVEQLARARLEKYHPESQLLKPIKDFFAQNIKKKLENQTSNSIEKDNVLLELAQTSETLDADVARDFGDYMSDEDNNMADDPDHSADDLHQRGNLAFENKNYNEAIRLFTQSLDIDKTNLNIYMDRALAYFKVNDYQSAADDCTYILSVDPHNKQAVDLRKECSTKILDEMLNNNDDNPPTVSKLASLAMEINNVGEGSYPFSSPSNSPNTRLTTPVAMDADENRVLSDDDERGSLVTMSPANGREHSGDENSPPNNWETRAQSPYSISYRKNIGEPMVTFNSKSYNRTPTTHMAPFDEVESEPSSPISQVNDVQQRIHDAISNSKFSPLIQSWLRERVPESTGSYYSSYYDLPWSNSPSPYSVHTLENDIYRNQRYDDHEGVILRAKLLLKNGILDYHRYSETLVTTLIYCIDAYANKKAYPNVIEYASEALEYNQTHSNVLFHRAKALYNEKHLALSYVDCEKAVKIDYRHYSASTLLSELEEELLNMYGDEWREHLPKENIDVFLEYVRLNGPTTNEPFDANRYMILANVTFEDACYIHSIKYYSTVIELDPTNLTALMKRAVCYVKVFEAKKAIADCDRILDIEQNHFEALYTKARAYKVQRDDYNYGYILQECVKLQPTNAILLTEFHSIRHHHIPREKRRLRPSIAEVKSDTIVNRLTWFELEQMHSDAYVYDASDLSDDLAAVRLDDIRSQCAFVLSLPVKNLFKVINVASKKLLEVVINASQAMIELEQTSTGNPYFSYAGFCLNLFDQVARLPSAQNAFEMLDDSYRQLLHTLIDVYSSLPEFCDVTDLLKQLKQ